MELMKKHPNKGAYGHLCHGRRPFAIADIRGSACYPSVIGTVSFYATPAGVLISADLSGLPQTTKKGRGAVFGVCFASRESERCGHCPKLCSVLPPLYERNGNAWCSVVTGKLSPSDLIDRRVILRERSDRCPGDCGREIASGNVTSPDYSHTR